MNTPSEEFLPRMNQRSRRVARVWHSTVGKIQQSALWEAVDGRVLIYIYKERMLDDVEQRYPARHHVMVDDKLRILAAMKNVLGTDLRRSSRARDTTRSIHKLLLLIQLPIVPSSVSAI